MKLGDTNEDDEDDEDEVMIRSASLCSVIRTACALHFFWKTNMHCFIFSYRVASFYTIKAIFKCELSIQIFFIIIIFSSDAPVAGLISSEVLQRTDGTDNRAEYTIITSSYTIKTYSISVIITMIL